jgi:hypothetical protein
VRCCVSLLALFDHIDILGLEIVEKHEIILHLCTHTVNSNTSVEVKLLSLLPLLLLLLLPLPLLLLLPPAAAQLVAFDGGRSDDGSRGSGGNSQSLGGQLAG